METVELDGQLDPKLEGIGRRVILFYAKTSDDDSIIVLDTKVSITQHVNEELCKDVTFEFVFLQPFISLAYLETDTVRTDLTILQSQTRR